MLTRFTVNPALYAVLLLGVLVVAARLITNGLPAEDAARPLALGLSTIMLAGCGVYLHPRLTMHRLGVKIEGIARFDLFVAVMAGSAAALALQALRG